MESSPLAHFIDLVITGLAVGALYGLVALSISIIYAGLDIVHFAQGEILTMGAFFCWVLVYNQGLSMPAACLLAVAATVVVAVIIQRVVYNSILKFGGGFTVRGITFMVAGFGVSTVLQNLYWIIWNPMPKPFAFELGSPIVLGSIRLQPVYALILAVSMVLMIALAVFFKKTRLGLAVLAVSYNKPVSSLMGINVNRTMSVTFGLAAALTAAAGILIAPITFVQYNMGLVILQKAFCAAVIGGFGNVTGSILGGLILGVAESLGAGYISTGHKDMIGFIIMIVMLMIRPGGIFNFRVKQKA
ncbi:MAG: branched-chain amino acid ABC transporter permease [Planctomycetota bacterium]|nr:branched-chain amino acid ABC transporter permease [Planctomycetota bacterium]